MQSVIFVQPDPAAHQFTMRRVQVTHRFDRSVFVRDTPLPKEEQLTAKEAEEGLLPKEPLRPGERVLLAGAVELKAALQDLESRPEKKRPTSLQRTSRNWSWTRSRDPRRRPLKRSQRAKRESSRTRFHGPRISRKQSRAIVVSCQCPVGGRRTMGMRHYRDLIAWQKAMDLVVCVYEATKDFLRKNGSV